MEPLSFDSHAESDVVKRFPTSANVFVSTLAGTRFQNLPDSNSSHSATEALHLSKKPILVNSPYIFTIFSFIPFIHKP